MAMTADNLNGVLAGISNSDTVFYAVGGSILVALAGIWGFRKVWELLDERDYQNYDFDAEGAWENMPDHVSDRLFRDSEEVKD